MIKQTTDKTECSNLEHSMQCNTLKPTMDRTRDSRPLTAREPTEAPPPELLSVKDVARMLTCGQRTVYRMSDMGTMPGPIRMNGLVRWPRRKLIAWIDAGCPAIRNATDEA